MGQKQLQNVYDNLKKRWFKFLIKQKAFKKSRSSFDSILIHAEESMCSWLSFSINQNE